MYYRQKCTREGGYLASGDMSNNGQGRPSLEGDTGAGLAGYGRQISGETGSRQRPTTPGSVAGEEEGTIVRAASICLSKGDGHVAACGRGGAPSTWSR